MSSITHHHAEWLSLLEISGPFLSMPVLLQAFPQGLDSHDPELSQSLKAAYEEWADNQSGLSPDPAIHTAWVFYVLEQVLGFSDEILLEGQTIPSSLKAEIPEHNITLRPDLALIEPNIDNKNDDKPARILIKVYPRSQDLDKPLSGSHWKASIDTQMMELLHATNIKLGLVTNGEQWTLVHAPRGETTSFISWYANLWFDESLTLRALRSLLGASRFFGVPGEETLEVLLTNSAKDQHEVTDQLGYQVRQAVEILISDLDKADIDLGRTLLSEVSEERLYEAALTVMMRLVFLLSAEERRLLPLDDPFYADNYAVSTLRAQLREIADQFGEDLLERRTDAWNRLLATFRAVYAGVRHDRLTLIAYGGSLLDPDRFPFIEGRQRDTTWRDTPADPLPVDNRTVLHLLDSLQILQVKVPGGGPAEARRLSFRALDIEQIGHVYEGLLDHVAVRAEEPVLGLAGTKDKEPEIPLSVLEEQAAKDQDSLLSYLKSETGRTKNALENALKSEQDAFRLQRLRVACGNDESLYQRILSFAGLVRDDDSGFPIVIPAGAVYVTAGPTRRATGTHYTPRSLTEPIVQHTLEPQVYEGPANGWSKEKWVLRSPKHILDLKVCDMAMGSGAFLVQACRYISERLVESWENTERVKKERSGFNQLLLTPEGLLVDNPDQAIPAGADERLALARRLVVDRCLYGVDKNPLAVEMAKLSLWLITLDKNLPFTFLDHSLKCGDSLVGASEDDFQRWAHSDRSPQGSLFDQVLQEQLETAKEKRTQLQSFQVVDIHDIERKKQMLKEADEVVGKIKLGCDLIIGVNLLGVGENEQQNLLNRLLLDYLAGKSMDKPVFGRIISAARSERAFHWEFEFPEVFEKGGFNAFVGNPPFQGGQRIRRELGEKYLLYLKARWSHSKGSADLCSYFFLHAYELSRVNGSIGLLATNTIAQGDTRELGLERISQLGGNIYFAINNLSWPGRAAVIVDVLQIYKGDYKGIKLLDHQEEDYISTWLDNIKISSSPFKLAQNGNKSFQGSNLVGIGFSMQPKEASALISRNNENSEVLFPYIIGHDINLSPTQEPGRWVISFFDWPLKREINKSWFEADKKQKNDWMRTGIVPLDYPFKVAADFPDCLSIVREKVYPQRMNQRREIRKRYWWRYGETAPGLYTAISDLQRVIVIALTNKTLAFVFLPTNIVFSHATVVIASDRDEVFALLQSTIHLEWTRRFGSTMKGDQRYTPTDCFENFPFPTSLDGLQLIGKEFYQHRQNLLVSNQIGLTALYNDFHDPMENSKDIIRLRELQIQMDKKVLENYGWSDINLNQSFYDTRFETLFTMSTKARKEVITRLMKLNQQRYQKEVAQGLHEKKGSKRRKKSGGRKARKLKENDKQLGLF